MIQQTPGRRTRVKICGITRAGDAVLAGQLGVDAVGLVFYEKSPRNISVKQAIEVCSQVPAFMNVVALFMDAEADFIQQVVDQVPLDLLQFHGSETAEFCEAFSMPYIKAIGMQGAMTAAGIKTFMHSYPGSRGFLLDSHALGKAGGTGTTFDWSTIPETIRSEIILAGGIGPDNVETAIRQVQPYAIDVSSGVESTPGVKDKNQIQQLMNNVKRVDCENE